MSSKFAAADFDLMAELREERATYKAIAARLSRPDRPVTASEVSWHCLRLGVDVLTPWPLWEGVKGPAEMKRGDHIVRRFTPAEDAALLALEAAGTSVYRMAQQLGRRHNSIKGRLMTLARRDARREAA